MIRGERLAVHSRNVIPFFLNTYSITGIDEFPEYLLAPNWSARVFIDAYAKTQLPLNEDFSV